MLHRSVVHKVTPSELSVILTAHEEIERVERSHRIYNIRHASAQGYGQVMPILNAGGLCGHRQSGCNRAVTSVAQVEIYCQQA